MGIGRSLIRMHRGYFLLLLLCAIAVRAFIPSGYMIAGNARTFTVEICADSTGERMTRQIEISTDSGTHDPRTDPGKISGHCAFASLTMAGVSGADPALLASALVFILLLGFSSVRFPRAQGPAHLWPPMRGPPASI